MKILIVTILFAFSSLLAQNNATDTPPQKSGNLLVGGFGSIGYGVLTGNASEYFNNPILLPLTGDLIYKNFMFQLNLDAGYSKVSKSMAFENGKGWNEGDDAWHNVLGANVGYSLYNNSSLRVTPFAGYAYQYISKTWWDPSDISDYEPSNNSINAGILFDLKNIISGKNSDNLDYLGLRISVGAYIPFDVKLYPQYYDGTTIYLSVGIVTLSLVN
jgi:hypothetical protein